MLKNTFCHLSGIGVKTEQRLWNQGISDWQHFLEQADALLPQSFVRRFGPQVQTSCHELTNGNAEFFVRSLPTSECWRLFAEFRHSVAYVDIETTGCGPEYDQITTIALYDGQRTRTFVSGENLEKFADTLLNYKLIVTFNGSCFDLPKIRHQLQVSLPPAHIDLRFVLKSLGYKGGLKKCEKIVGCNRGLLDGVDGYSAVLLWQAFERCNEPNILETLLSYNVEDVLSLETLMHFAYNSKLQSVSGPEILPLKGPEQEPHNPYTAHQSVLEDHVFPYIQRSR
jgi:hypothetical protein